MYGRELEIALWAHSMFERNSTVERFPPFFKLKWIPALVTLFRHKAALLNNNVWLQQDDIPPHLQFIIT